MQNIQKIENWKPTGANPKNQRHLAIPPNSKAVMIHPKAQERMENDPEFAKEVMERMARHKYFMQLLKYGEANKSLLLYGSGSFMGSFSGGSSLTGWASEYTSFQSGQAAEDEIKSMLQSGLREKLGDTICGMPTEQVIEQTWSDIDNCRSIRNSLMMM